MKTNPFKKEKGAESQQDNHNKKYPLVGKRHLEDAYGCKWKTINKRLKRVNIDIPEDEKAIFPATVEKIINALGYPPNKLEGLEIPF